jgi:glutamate-ammonia-ligase adenylyltransferase
MTARSDLDLMTLYANVEPTTASADKGWGAETFFARFTQRLITALSAPTADGDLYTVDLQLRPSGRAGPVAVSLATFQRYYASEAETWEALALTRARVVWASSAAFAQEAEAAIAAALRLPRDPARTMADAADMRALMATARPPHGPWDLKLSRGGLVDIEFAVQSLQIIHAAAGGPLRANTGQALQALRHAGLADADTLATLTRAWRLQQDLTQVLKLALDDPADPTAEPERFKSLLARAGGEPDFDTLAARLTSRQAEAHAAFLTVVGRPAGLDGAAGGEASR